MHHLMVKKNFANFGGPAPMLFSRFSLQSSNAERYTNPRKGDSLHPVSKWEPPQIQWKWSGNAIESW